MESVAILVRCLRWDGGLSQRSLGVDGGLTIELRVNVYFEDSESSVFASHRCLVIPDGFGRYVVFQGTKHIERPIPFENLTCANSECGPGEFKCPNSYCILSSNVCDSKQDCPYGEDEQDCDDLSCPSFFRCRNSTRCLHLAKVCDGVVDCPLADDERRCGDRCEGRTGCAEGIVSVTPELDLYMGTIVFYSTTRLDLSGHNLNSANFHIADPLDVGHLNVSNCSIKRLNREGNIRYLLNLKELDLSYNKHWSIRRAQFWRYQNLQILNLSHNRRLSKVWPKTFLENSKLKILNLANCALKSLYVNMFSGLTSLVHLDLSYNRIDFIEEGSFEGVPGLKELLLKGNPISRFSAGIFDGLVSLELLTSDNFVLCCDEVKPKSLSGTGCHAPQNSLSSCKDLMQKDLLRIFIWVQGFMALVGNALVFLYRTIYNRAPLRHPYGQFLLSLCISDFFMGIYLIIIAATDLRFRGLYIWHDSSWRRSTLCQMAGFLSTLSSEASAIFICLVTFDRFLIIRFPFREIYLSTRSSAIATAIGWLVAVVFSVVPLLPGASTWQLYGQNAACLALPLTSERLPGWQYSTAIFIGFNLLTFLLIAVGQYLIYRYLREGSALKTKQRRSQELSVARNLSLVVITDFLCWFPVCMMGLMALNGTSISGEVYAWTAVFVLPVNSAINPILYTLPYIRHLDTTNCCRRKQSLSRASNSMQGRCHYTP
ncbi:G-protein coupled receptor GRL101-like [Haliotis rubra]|uniref:G-protein coupled receptor GRL101-like n=1 Tax=Haliotis rubra TaxID=36100 RepID=UPI001EE58DF4|nr:G-protein coupled receptor GRL101-like [Haliotis rubra]